jgi:PhzF family phenazine biosynthesis protein
MRRFAQVDVFSEQPLLGNPVAVVLDADGLGDAEMQRVASWTNLSETTFVLPPTVDGADYRLRIFTPAGELPFAGHPTLGSCHAWLEAGGTPAGDDIVQECGAGLVRVRRAGGRLAFEAPPRTRSGPPSEAELANATAELGIAPDSVVTAEWADNGPGWLALLLADPEAVLAVEPRPLSLPIGLVGLYPPGGEVQLEVRGFFALNGQTFEDPVTGSLNAALAQWLIGDGRLGAPYVAAQGTALGRRGRVHVSAADGEIWVGGATITAVTGQLRTAEG